MYFPTKEKFVKKETISNPKRFLVAMDIKDQQRSHCQQERKENRKPNTSRWRPCLVLPPITCSTWQQGCVAAIPTHCTFCNTHLQSKNSLQRGLLGLTTGQTEFLSHSISENVKLDLDQWESAIIIKQKKSRETSVLSGSTESILITSYYCLVQNTVPSAWTG